MDRFMLYFVNTGTLLTILFRIEIDTHFTDTQV